MILPKGAEKVLWAVVHRPVNWFGVLPSETMLNDDKLKQMKKVVSMYKLPDGIYMECVDREGEKLWVPVPNISHALIQKINDK